MCVSPLNPSSHLKWIVFVTEIMLLNLHHAVSVAGHVISFSISGCLHSPNAR